METAELTKSVKWLQGLSVTKLIIRGNASLQLKTSFFFFFFNKRRPFRNILLFYLFKRAVTSAWKISLAFLTHLKMAMCCCCCFQWHSNFSLLFKSAQVQTCLLAVLLGSNLKRRVWKQKKKRYCKEEEVGVKIYFNSACLNVWKMAQRKMKWQKMCIFVLYSQNHSMFCAATAFDWDKNVLNQWITNRASALCSPSLIPGFSSCYSVSLEDLFLSPDGQIQPRNMKGKKRLGWISGQCCATPSSPHLYIHHVETKNKAAFICSHNMIQHDFVSNMMSVLCPKNSCTSSNRGWLCKTDTCISLFKEILVLVHSHTASRQNTPPPLLFFLVSCWNSRIKVWAQQVMKNKCLYTSDQPVFSHGPFKEAGQWAYTRIHFSAAGSGQS